MPRHAFQTELYALTTAQRNAVVTRLQTELATRPTVESSTVEQRTVRGDAEVFCEATLTTRSDGDSLMDIAVERAQTLGAGIGAVSGRASYVSMRTTDPDANTITARLAQAPGWAISEIVTPYNAP
jgi:hypothetical protein